MIRTIHIPITTIYAGRLGAVGGRCVFCLREGARVHTGGATAPPDGRTAAVSRQRSEALAERSERRGALHPSPASHHGGVSGGGGNDHLTPAWCEAGSGGENHA